MTAKYYDKKGSEITNNNIRILSAIYQHSKNNKYIWYSRLMQLFKGSLSKTDISNSKEQLLDEKLIELQLQGKKMLTYWILTEKGDRFIRRIME